MKRGFTLAEVLITVAIIGVVMSISIPSLATSNQKKVYGAALATSVDNLEKTFNTMLLSDGTNWLGNTQFYDTFSGNNASATRAAGQLGRFIDIVSFGTTAEEAAPGYTLPLKNLGTGNAGDNSFPEGGFYFKTKHGSLLHIVQQNIAEDQSTVQDENFGLNRQVFLLTIDINGAEKPNTIGRDVFRYAIGNNGKLYPIGGSDWAQYASTGKWSENDSDDSNSGYTCCGCDVTVNASTPGWGCAARLAESGYKMDY